MCAFRNQVFPRMRNHVGSPSFRGSEASRGIFPSRLQNLVACMRKVGFQSRRGDFSTPGKNGPSLEMTRKMVLFQVTCPNAQVVFT
jgi:hypothetical protein